jgi:hypothetical protein
MMTGFYEDWYDKLDDIHHSANEEKKMWGGVLRDGLVKHCPNTFNEHFFRAIYPARGL